MPRRKSARNQVTNNNKAVSANDAPDVNAAATKLTPYQGTHQTFGMFKCQKCNRFWTSNVSWANYGQKCNKCKINIYPFKQIPLESDKSKKLDKSDPAKHHPMELCQKCQKLGRFCGKKFTKRRPSVAAPDIAV